MSFRQGVITDDCERFLYTRDPGMVLFRYGAARFAPLSHPAPYAHTVPCGVRHKNVVAVVASMDGY